MNDQLNQLGQGLLYLDGRNSQKIPSSRPGRLLNSNNATQTHSNFVKL